jgi:2-polyprenyl-6-methoxyphenol hydroxylase-like FAD-dependent oxidoreductase
VSANTNETLALDQIRRTPMNTPVLIVGAGPVGLTLACELTRYRVPVRIVDKAAQRTDKSKAIVIWSRTLELLDRGDQASAPFVEAGFKVDGVNIVGANGVVVGHVRMDSVASPYPYALMLPQSDTERLLEERLQRLGVSVERSTEATALTIGTDGAEATLRRADGRQESVHADWLAGCDGAHSIVRHTLAVPFSGETMGSDWILADVHMKGYPFPDNEVAVYWAREGVLPIFPISPGRYRVIANIPPSGEDHPRDPTLEEIQTIVERRGPKGASLFDPIWLSGFRINSRKVASYRSGRVFLSGDAAHVHSPAGGEGMNTGMQDAFNLAWKLALAINGTCGEALLDTYSPERSGVGDEVLKNTERLTAIGTLHNPIAEELRNIVGRVAFGLAPVQHAFADQMSQVAVGYPESPMNGRGHGSFHPAPGHRMAPINGRPPFGAGAEPRFTLLASSSPAVTDLLASYPKLLNGVLVTPPAADGVWLIRPDGYVAATAPTADLSSISDVLGRMSA